MIEKSIDYNDNDFSKHLKGLGLSEKEIKYISGETKRKKFNNGGEAAVEMVEVLVEMEARVMDHRRWRFIRR